MNTDRKSGRVIFWNTMFGFIQQADNSTIYFNRKSINNQAKEQISLLCDVEYSTSVVQQGKHKGELVAVVVEKENEPDLSTYKRYVGRIREWNNTDAKKNGYIASPQQEKLVRFFETRSLDKNCKYKNGDLVVFHQIKSTKNPNQLFALFAYPLSNEKSIAFLQQQYSDSRIPEIKEYLDTLQPKQESLSVEEQFNQEVLRLGFVDSLENYKKLKKLIATYKDRDYQPEYEFISAHCIDHYLIQLFEDQVINSYDKELMKVFFNNTIAAKKRFLISLIDPKDKQEILSFHIEHLKSQKKLLSLNNHVKTLLDIIYRREKDVDHEVYAPVKAYLFKNLHPNELFELWEKGYIDEIDQLINSELLDLFNYKIAKSLCHRNEKQYSIPVKTIYDRFLITVNDQKFKTCFPRIIACLKFYNEEFKGYYDNAIAEIITKLNDNNCFILWLYNVKINFEAGLYYESNHQELNDYEKIRFLLRITDESKPETLPYAHIGKVTQQGLYNYIDESSWEGIVTPTNNESQSYQTIFLDDIEKYISRYQRSDICLREIAHYLYQSILKYSVHHLRMWLNNNVSDELFDYVGYRQVYSKLSPEEQKKFTKKADPLLKDNYVHKVEYETVKPCTKVVFIDEKTKLYTATIQNIYFDTESIELRKEDNDYTDKYLVNDISSGLNRIPSSSALCDMSIEILVKNETKIIDVKGLYDVLMEIHTAEILDDLKTPDSTSEDSLADNDSNKPYAEDWELRKKIHSYLSEKQDKNKDPIVLNEPKYIQRERDENQRNTIVENVALFSIKTNNGYGIIWENIDLNYDRATFVFRSEESNYSDQISKILNAITSTPYLRSRLNCRSEEEESRIFKNNLGYVGSCRKQRGKQFSFENWLEKLNNLLNQPVPEIPSKTELERLVDWVNEKSFPKRITRITTKKYIPKTINEENIPVLDLPFAEDIETSVGTLTVQEEAEPRTRRDEIYISLKQFNDFFLENLN